MTPLRAAVLIVIVLGLAAALSQWAPKLVSRFQNAAQAHHAALTVEEAR